ncbi:MAG: cell cycle transcriptional regulator TrcR [Pseudomonadota bacterium]
MSDLPLNPKATAVWLVDNTALTFDQIAAFCGLHALEVKGIADGDVAAGLRGINPINNDQLTREEIEKAEADEGYLMKLSKKKVIVPVAKAKTKRYIPTSRRQERPNAIAWIVRNHPEVPDRVISKLLGTTKQTIQAIRDKSHWNSANLEPMDPVTLGFCTQFDLDMAVQKAAEERTRLEEAGALPEGATLQPAEETTAPAEEEETTGAPDLDKVFANFGSSDSEQA